MQNVSEHFSCYNYVNDQPAIELKNLRKNTQSQFYAIRYKLFFLLEGKALVEAGVKNAEVVDRGHFWFVPQGEAVKIKMLDNSVILVLRTEFISLCECYTLEQLYGDLKDENREKLEDRTLYPALIRPQLWHCLSGLCATMADELFCRPYFNIKIKEIFLLLSVYYTKRELYLVFYHMLTGDISFSETVRSMWNKYGSVNALAKEMGYTPSGFYKRFTAVFDTSPRKWIQKQKELSIYSDLKSNDLSLKSVSRKWRFASVQSLSNYCRKCYGETPMQIRGVNPTGRNGEIPD